MNEQRPPLGEDGYLVCLRSASSFLVFIIYTSLSLQICFLKVMNPLLSTII
jgi:hypothetical protein